MQAFSDLQAMTADAVNVLGSMYDNASIRVGEREAVVEALTSQLTDGDNLVGQLQEQVNQTQQEIVNQTTRAEAAENRNHDLEVELGASDEIIQRLQEQLQELQVSRAAPQVMNLVGMATRSGEMPPPPYSPTGSEEGLSLYYF